jgi:hypothetical protein
MVSLPPIFDFYEFMKESKVRAKTPSKKTFLMSDKSRFFFSVVLGLPTDKYITLDKIYSTMTIKELKLQIEAETGIPGYVWWYTQH